METKKMTVEISNFYKKISNYKHFSKYLWIFSLLMIILFLNIITPKPKNLAIRINVGAIATKDIIAPYNFPILKDSAKIEKEKAKIIDNTLPVVDYKETTTVQIKDDINKFFSLINKEMYKQIPLSDKIAYVKSISNTSFDNIIYNTLLNKDNIKIEGFFLKLIDNLYKSGIIQDKSKLPFKSTKKVILKTHNTEKIIDADEIFSRKEAITYIKTKSKTILNPTLFRSIEALSEYYLKPNLEYNSQETINKQNEAIAAIKLEKGFVSKGEMIVRAHDPITMEVEEKLISMKQSQPSNYRREHFQILFGKNLLLVLLSIIFFFILLSFCYDILIDTSKAWIFLIAFMLNTIIVLFVHSYSLFLITIIPFAMIIGFLIDKKFAAVAGIFIAFMYAVTFGLNFTLLLFLIIMSLISLLYIDHLHRRSGFYLILIMLISAEMLFIAFIEMIKFNSFIEIVRNIGYSTANVTVSIFIVLGIIPLFERIFNITSSLTLIELTDLNHPLLQKLAIEAPGTHNHSLNVATMSEAAARRIHANSLLCRVGGYFHDIGKSKNPIYFVENQINIQNPHNSLAPSMSKIIIVNHIKDGVEMAKQYKLPKEIIDIIKQHHGNSVMEGFYFKAKDNGESIMESDFRYSGPSPTSKEAGIILLADSIEAAIRVLKNPVPHRIEALINQIVKNKLQDNQLNNTPLNFNDIEKIKEAFLPYLIAINHKRLHYPSTKEFTEK
jgi:putative nucleotidyltransferase with HDIG domain